MTGVTQSELPGGAPVLIERLSGVRSVGMSVLVPCGAACDPVDKQGLSPMWEELLHRGAGGLDSRAQADAFDRAGTNRSVSGGSRYMRIGAVFPGERIDEALPLVADMLLRPRFDEGAIGPTRDLALQAIESLKDDPHERAVLGARARHRPQPFNRSGLGLADHIGSITRDDLVDGWHERVRPGGSVIALAGAVDPDHATARLAELFSDWEGSFDQPEAMSEPPRGYAHEDDDSNQVQIVVVEDGPAESEDDAWAERVVSAVLSGGMSGRLFTEVREKRGLCYAVSSSYSAGVDTGVVTSYVGTTPERARESLDVLLAELDRVQSQGGAVTREEFGRAIVGMKSRLVFKGESTSARASGLAGDYTRLGRVRTLDEITSRIDAITLDEVNAYLARRRPGKCTIQTLGPEALR